jgi:muskelin
MSNENFPVLYISVIPLLSYGPSFNFSIWFIELIGIEDELIVSDTLRNYNEQKEKITIRLILKHLRDRGHLGSYKALSQETQIQLEDPEITDLYNCLLDDGNFDEVENIMKRLIESKLFLS